MKTIALVVLLFFYHASFCQYLAKDLSAEYNKNSIAFENKYFNQRLSITATVFEVIENKMFIQGYDKNHHLLYLTANGQTIFLTCRIPFEQKQILTSFTKGATITVSGIYSEKMAYGMVLTDCEFTKAAPMKSEPVKKAPPNIPIGKYSVYQNSAADFSYQYTFQLNSYTSYTMNGKVGKCTYDNNLKVIRFTSGLIKGFVGKYRPTNPTNEKDPPTIVIDHRGNVPNLNKLVGMTYQYAYFKEKE